MQIQLADPDLQVSNSPAVLTQHSSTQHARNRVVNDFRPAPRHGARHAATCSGRLPKLMGKAGFLGVIPNSYKQLTVKFQHSRDTGQSCSDSSLPANTHDHYHCCSTHHPACRFSRASPTTIVSSVLSTIVSIVTLPSSTTAAGAMFAVRTKNCCGRGAETRSAKLSSAFKITGDR